MHAAAKSGHPQICKLILGKIEDGDMINPVDSNGDSPLHIAAIWKGIGHKEICLMIQVDIFILVIAPKNGILLPKLFY